MPTETVYGLAAAATDVAAVTMVYAAKERPSFDPLIVHLAHKDPEVAVEGVAELSGLDTRGRERFVTLTRRFWPGPLTCVLPRHSNIPDLVASGLPTVAVRVPDHPVAQALLAAFGGPVVAPSANRFGRISPTTADHVIAELEGRIPAVLDGGACRVGVESTIVAIAGDGSVRLLRPGGVAREDLISVVGPVEVGAGDAIEAPGQTPEHYAPGTPSVMLPGRIDTVSGWAKWASGPPVGVLRVHGPAEDAHQQLVAAGVPVALVLTLSATADPHEAARNLFAFLRQLDDSAAERLLFEPVDRADGLWAAIMDRLRRASSRGALPAR